MITCRKKNGKLIYYFPSRSKSGIEHIIMWISAEMRYECSCPFHAFPKSIEYEKCSHIKTLEKCLRERHEMIIYDDRIPDYNEI